MPQSVIDFGAQEVVGRDVSAAVEPTPDGTVRFVEIESGREPIRVLSRLGGCTWLTEEALKDLTRPDDVPRRRANRDWVALSATLITLVEQPGTGSVDRALIYEPVELCVGPSWIFSVWHPETSDVLQGRPPGKSPGDREVVEAIKDAWTSAGGESSGDLGLLLLCEIARRYKAAIRGLQDSFDEWEGRFFAESAAVLADGHAFDDPEHLDRLRALGMELNRLRQALVKFRRFITPLDVPRRDAAQAWFRDVTLSDVATHTDEMIDESLDRLHHLEEELQGALAALQSLGIAQHLAATQAQLSASERLQRTAELVAAVFLIPTLVAAIYGANTALPGERTWTGFWVMIILMVSAAFATAVGLRALRKRSSSRGASSASTKGSPPLELPG